MTISGATRTLLDRYGSDPAPVNRQWESMVVEVLLQYGSRADVEALLPVFLAAPSERGRLVPLFARYGDTEVGERLLRECFTQGRLREGMPSEVLHAVGYLGCESAAPVLWDHVDAPDCGYDESKDACLGLLHLSCHSVQKQLTRALERYLGLNVFPEFLPVLAVKTDGPSWLDRLAGWGEWTASTDCNGGLILGIALHGVPGHGGGPVPDGAAREEFVRLLWNPRWEAFGGGTGAERWAYAGARVLGMGLPELYADLVSRLRSDARARGKRHCLATFTALLRLRAHRGWLGLRMAPDPDPAGDSAAALCGLMFDGFSPQDEPLRDLAHDTLDRDDPILAELHGLEQVLRSEARHDLELGEVAEQGRDRGSRRPLPPRAPATTP